VVVQHKIGTPWEVLKYNQTWLAKQTEMINFTHFQTFPKFPKSGQKFLLLCTLLSINAAIKKLLTMKLSAKSEHDANGSLSYLKSCVCECMSAVWFKILSRIDICMKVIQARQATLDTEVANIPELLEDLAELRHNWQSCVEWSNYSCI